MSLTSCKPGKTTPTPRKIHFHVVTCEPCPAFLSEAAMKAVNCEIPQCIFVIVSNGENELAVEITEENSLNSSKHSSRSPISQPSGCYNKQYQTLVV